MRRTRTSLGRAVHTRVPCGAPQAASGGAFSFPHLNLTVPAAAGRALLWPHLMDGDLATPDMRTEHEGTEVIASPRLQPYVPQAAALRGSGCRPTWLRLQAYLSQPQLQHAHMHCPRLPPAVPQVAEGVKVGVNLHAHRSNLRTRVLAGCTADDEGGAAVSHTFGFESTPGATANPSPHPHPHPNTNLDPNPGPNPDPNPNPNQVPRRCTTWWAGTQSRRCPG